MSRIAGPPASPVEGASIGQFLTRVLVRSPENSDITAFVTQASLQKDLLTVILDIDAFRSVEYGSSDERIMQTFMELRNFKNQLFFDSITPRTIELYK